MHTYITLRRYVLKRTYAMHNVCNICMPQAICDVISSIGIGIGAAAADSIGYRAPARYQSNPSSLGSEPLRISI